MTRFHCKIIFSIDKKHTKFTNTQADFWRFLRIYDSIQQIFNPDLASWGRKNLVTLHICLVCNVDLPRHIFLLFFPLKPRIHLGLSVEIGTFQQTICIHANSNHSSLVLWLCPNTTWVYTRLYIRTRFEKEKTQVQIGYFYFAIIFSLLVS